MPFRFWNSSTDDAGDVEAHEVRRQPHHRPVAALGQLHVALDVDQPLQPRRRGVPEQAALEQAAAEPAEVLARQALALRRRELGKAELEVAQGHLAARGDEVPAGAPEAVAQPRLHAERQPVQQPQQRQQCACGQERASPIRSRPGPGRSGAAQRRVSGSRRAGPTASGGPRRRAEPSEDERDKRSFRERAGSSYNSPVAELLDYLRGDAKQIR